MKSPLFLKLLGAALLLILVTLVAVDATITHYAPLSIDPAATALRQRVVLISLSAAVFALATAYAISHSLSQRVSRLKRVARTVLDTGASPQPVADANDELGALENSLTVMAGRVRDTADRLRLESARGEAILSSMAEGVLAVDSGLRVTFCNNSFARLIGLKGPAPTGAPLLEVARDTGLLQVLSHVASSG